MRAGGGAMAGGGDRGERRGGREGGKGDADEQTAMGLAGGCVLNVFVFKVRDYIREMGRVWDVRNDKECKRNGFSIGLGD